VVPCYRRESVSTGEDTGQEGNPRRGQEEEAVGCQLGCSSTVQADLTRGKQKEEGSPETKKYEHRGRIGGHDSPKPTVPTEQLRRECNTREKGHQGNYFTNSAKLATVY